MPKKQKGAPVSQSKRAQKAQAPLPPAEPQPPATPFIEYKHQQRLLDIYAAAFAEVLARDNFAEILQEIKQALFNRDFAAAFEREDYLEAYAARWSPTRTLCYATIFQSLEERFNDVLLKHDDLPSEGPSIEQEAAGEDAQAEPPVSELRMLCIGGCAAEQVAFASFLQSSSLRGTLTLLDSGPWSSISSIIQEHLTSPPAISPYASATAKASNHALISPSQLALQVKQQNVLSLSSDELKQLFGGGDRPSVVTIMFTLNELYTEGGIGKSTRFLGSLGEVLANRSLLLVVDSPGSYSEAAVGKEKKRYPMHWLLDHTLLEKSPTGLQWEKLESKDSVWFRLHEDLSYPIQLENMRYQLHLYRLTKGRKFEA
ncbi:SAM-dependent methyltransferase domain-containing protein [Sarocladium implicatum]|nr:SAM-dependent methyltransferase domain-containing protein [Sarocladium implicatum]